MKITITPEKLLSVMTDLLTNTGINHTISIDEFDALGDKYGLMPTEVTDQDHQSRIGVRQKMRNDINTVAGRGDPPWRIVTHIVKQKGSNGELLLQPINEYLAQLPDESHGQVKTTLHNRSEDARRKVFRYAEHIGEEERKELEYLESWTKNTLDFLERARRDRLDIEARSKARIDAAIATAKELEAKTEEDDAMEE